MISPSLSSVVVPRLQKAPDIEVRYTVINVVILYDGVAGGGVTVGGGDGELGLDPPQPVMKPTKKSNAGVTLAIRIDDNGKE